MDDKALHEAFRHRQHAQPHPAKHLPPGLQSVDSINIDPDRDRAILHFDVDCFYAQVRARRPGSRVAPEFNALRTILSVVSLQIPGTRQAAYSIRSQVEEVRNPALKGRPLGVTQKYLIVTSNYEARRLGITKLMGIQEAREKIPGLHLVRPALPAAFSDDFAVWLPPSCGSQLHRAWSRAARLAVSASTWRGRACAQRGALCTGQRRGPHAVPPREQAHLDTAAALRPRAARRYGRGLRRRHCRGACVRTGRHAFRRAGTPSDLCHALVAVCETMFVGPAAACARVCTGFYILRAASARTATVHPGWAEQRSS